MNRTATQRFIDPQNLGHDKNFDGAALPTFDHTRVNITSITSAAEIFPDPLGLKNQLRPINLLWLGITGDLMGRFGQHSFFNLFEAIPGLSQSLTIHGVGTRTPEKGQPIVDAFRQNGLPLANYQTLETALAAIARQDLQVDGIFVGSPPSEHLANCIACMQATGNRVQIFCEKPLVVPSELAAVEKLNIDHPNLIVPVDFFATTTPLFYLLTSERGAQILGMIGNPIAINGTLIETQPVEHARLGGNFGLLNLETAGGGIMLDCGIHSLAMALVYKMRGGTDMSGLDDFRSAYAPHTYLTQERVNQELGHGRIDVNTLRETGGMLSRLYTSTSCVINAQGAKGVAHDLYALDILTDKGYRLVVGVGTDFKPPYLSVTSPNGDTQMITFEPASKEVGYGGAFYDMLAQMLLGPKTEIIPTNSAMFMSSTSAIRDLAGVNSIAPADFARHAFGQMPSAAVPLPLEILDIVPNKGDSRR